MRDYIICNHKRSKARVKVDVCEQCKRMAKCSDYKGYIQPSLFPDFVKEMKVTKDAYRRAVKSPSMMKSKNTEIHSKHKQLTLNLLNITKTNSK